MDIVIFIGLQASGKSSFYRTRFADSHTLVSKDRLRNNPRPERRQRLLIEESLRAGKSVVVDNTNPTTTDRATLIDLGRSYGAKIIGYYFESRVAECLQRNQLRAGKDQIPDVAIYSTICKLQRPLLAEGFDELHYVRLQGEGLFEVLDWQENVP